MEQIPSTGNFGVELLALLSLLSTHFSLHIFVRLYSVYQVTNRFYLQALVEFVRHLHIYYVYNLSH